MKYKAVLKNAAVGLLNNSWEAPNIMLNEKKAYPETMQVSSHFYKKHVY